MGRYICEVKKDNSSRELSLVHPNKYNAFGSGNGIQFSDQESLNRYFNNHCIEENMLNNGSGFFLLFILFILFIIIFMCVGNGNSKSSTDVVAEAASKAGFGHYYF